MLRYYAIATAIVLAIAVFATAWRIGGERRANVEPTVRPVVGPTSDRGGETGDLKNRHDVALRGDAPWALSALPDCLIQHSEATGTDAYVRSKLPAGAALLPPGDRVRFGPCTISVLDGEAVVTRGDDRLRIPPPVSIYRTRDGLALLRRAGATAELRVYVTP